uniref:C-CAP/cofactor C-like domain-containing protein n=1 Tax=Globodera rostochiensis TaxID=31243 RepID=A0A914HBV6_GLORO
MFTFSCKPGGRLKKDGSDENISNIGINSTTSLSAIRSDTAFRDVSEKTVFKGSAELCGKPFSIHNCRGSVLVLLDHTATITIEKCNNCVIICGPCKGSIFVRNCTDCLILAACQQFRVQDSHDVEAHIHCSTKPTIEDSELIVAPLLMSYNGIEDDMASAGLDRALNRWDKVQNFTPDTGLFQLMPFDPFANGAIGSEVVSDELLEQLTTFMEKPEAQESVGLKLKTISWVLPTYELL